MWAALTRKHSQCRMLGTSCGWMPSFVFSSMCWPFAVASGSITSALACPAVSVVLTSASILSISCRNKGFFLKKQTHVLFQVARSQKPGCFFEQVLSVIMAALPQVPHAWFFGQRTATMCHPCRECGGFSADGCSLAQDHRFPPQAFDPLGRVLVSSLIRNYGFVHQLWQSLCWRNIGYSIEHLLLYCWLAGLAARRFFRGAANQKEFQFRFSSHGVSHTGNFIANFCSVSRKSLNHSWQIDSFLNLGRFIFNSVPVACQLQCFDSVRGPWWKDLRKPWSAQLVSNGQRLARGAALVWMGLGGRNQISYAFFGLNHVTHFYFYFSANRSHKNTWDISFSWMLMPEPPVQIWVHVKPALRVSRDVHSPWLQVWMFLASDEEDGHPVKPSSSKSKSKFDFLTRVCTCNLRQCLRQFRFEEAVVQRKREEFQALEPREKDCGWC